MNTFEVCKAKRLHCLFWMFFLWYLTLWTRGFFQSKGTNVNSINTKVHIFWKVCFFLQNYYHHEATLLFAFFPSYICKHCNCTVNICIQKGVGNQTVGKLQFKMFARLCISDNVAKSHFFSDYTCAFGALPLICTLWALLSLFRPKPMTHQLSSPDFHGEEKEQVTSIGQIKPELYRPKGDQGEGKQGDTCGKISFLLRYAFK